MAITQTDLERLEGALMRGELKVVYDGREVTMRSVDELKGAIAYAKSQLGLSPTASGSQTVAAFTRD